MIAPAYPSPNPVRQSTFGAICTPGFLQGYAVGHNIVALRPAESRPEAAESGQAGFILEAGKIAADLSLHDLDLALLRIIPCGGGRQYFLIAGVVQVALEKKQRQQHEDSFAEQQHFLHSCSSSLARKMAG